MKNNLKISDLYLLRCIITKINTNNFEGKDYNGKKYIIAKNEVTKSFKVGTDSSFYAIKEEKGLFFKKDVFFPLSKKEYEEIINNKSSATNEKEKKISLK